MKNLSLDAKTLLFGVAIGVGIMFVVGASTSTPPGRYQITSAGNYLAVLDSETGQVWAGNFNQQGTNAAAVPFKNCPQSSGDVFHPKSQ